MLSQTFQWYTNIIEDIIITKGEQVICSPFVILGQIESFMNQELKKIFSPLRIDMMISNGYLFQPIEVFSESLRSIAADKGRLFLPFLIFVVIGDLLAQVGVWAQFMVNLVLDPVLLIYVFSKFFSKTLGKTFHFTTFGCKW